MAFSLIKDVQETEYVKVRIASQAYTLGDLVYLDRTADAVDVLPVSIGNGTPNSIFGVAMQTVPATATEMLVAVIQPWQEWKADATNASVVNDKFQRMIIGAGAGIINNSHTDVAGSTAIFQQTGVIGALTSNHLVGNFLRISGISI
jgi:poly-gamma-glutamate capsule biosynthesis protein CapA/YwtB (metallophosphatase superfamily)